MSDTRKLPEDFTTRFLPMAAGGKMFDVPLMELSRDELLATAAFCMHEASSARDESLRQVKFAAELRRQ
jgi:hypothetical protein